MRKLFYLLILATLPMTSIFAQDQNKIVLPLSKQAPNWLKPYQAKYHVYRGGDKKGSVKRLLAQKNDHWELYTQSKLSLFFFSDKRTETTTFTFKQRKIIPLSYSYDVDNSFTHKRTTEFFDWDLKIIKGRRLQKGSWQLPLKKGISNPLSNQLLIRQYLINKFPETDKIKFSSPLKLTLQVSSKGKISSWDYQIKKGEKIHTNLGEFETVKVIRSHGSRRTLFWLSISHQFIPVKIYLEKNGKEQGTMVLAKLKINQKQTISAL